MYLRAMISIKFTYLLLNIGSILFPLFLSFDKKVHFYTHWWRLIPSILFGAFLFIVWDIWFVKEGVWHFNSEYLIGIWWVHLPLEEILFFICIPYACMFIYACLKSYFTDIFVSISKAITFIFLFFFLVMSVVYHQNLYSFVTFSGCFIILLAHFICFRTKYLGYFYFMWLVHLIPLFIVNGFLTSLPVVIYNDTENMGIRIGTVPFEDMFYSFFLLLLITTSYEGLKQIKKAKNLHS